MNSWDGTSSRCNVVVMRAQQLTIIKSLIAPRTYKSVGMPKQHASGTLKRIGAKTNISSNQ